MRTSLKATSTPDVVDRLLAEMVASRPWCSENSICPVQNEPHWGLVYAIHRCQMLNILKT